MAPVAGGIADAQENRFALAAGLDKGFVLPWIPIHRVIGMLQQIGALLFNQAIWFNLVSVQIYLHLFWPPALLPTCRCWLMSLYMQMNSKLKTCRLTRQAGTISIKSSELGRSRIFGFLYSLSIVGFISGFYLVLFLFSHLLIPLFSTSRL